jgi:phage tail-like protein
MIGSLNLYAWYNQVRNGDPNARRNVLIHLQNEDHTAVVVTWKVLRAWPVKYSFSTLNATSNEVVIEQLELACERVEIE